MTAGGSSPSRLNVQTRGSWGCLRLGGRSDRRERGWNPPGSSTMSDRGSDRGPFPWNLSKKEVRANKVPNGIPLLSSIGSLGACHF